MTYSHRVDNPEEFNWCPVPDGGAVSCAARLCVRVEEGDGGHRGCAPAQQMPGAPNRTTQPMRLAKQDALLFIAMAVLSAAVLYHKLSAVWTLLAGALFAALSSAYNLGGCMLLL